MILSWHSNTKNYGDGIAKFFIEKLTNTELLLLFSSQLNIKKINF